MSNFISVNVLKQYNPGLTNRGADGEAKQVVVGGINRARISSQALKTVIREKMDLNEIRTAHVEDLVESILDAYVADGSITDEQKDSIGLFVCSKAVLGSDSWKKRASVNPPKIKKKIKKDEDKKDKDNGRQVLVTNEAELMAILSTCVKYAKEKGFPSEKEAGRNKAEKALLKDILSALNEVQTSVSKALFGNMQTDGVVATTYGSVQMGHSFSIDEFALEIDDWTAVYAGRVKNYDDPFFGPSFKEFNERESAKVNSETMNSSEMYSNVMYTHANINIKELIDNMKLSVIGKSNDCWDSAVESTGKEKVAEFIATVCTVVPSGKQRSNSTHVAPAVAYIECIEHGAVMEPDFSKVIRPHGDEGVAEQGIKHICEFAKDTAFRTGTIRKYVILSAPYKQFKEQFEEAGVQVVSDLEELKKILADEYDRLS